MYLTDSTIVASYDKADEVASEIINLLSENETLVGYGILGLTLALARLVHLEEPLSIEEEIKFTTDLTEWSGMYWGAGKDKLQS